MTELALDKADRVRSRQQLLLTKIEKKRRVAKLLPTTCKKRTKKLAEGATRVPTGHPGAEGDAISVHVANVQKSQLQQCSNSS